MDPSHHQSEYQHDHQQAFQLEQAIGPMLHPTQPFHNISTAAGLLYHDDSHSPLLDPHSNISPAIGSTDSAQLSKQLSNPGLHSSITTSHPEMYHSRISGQLTSCSSQSLLSQDDPTNIYTRTLWEQPRLSSSESPPSTPLLPSISSDLDVFSSHSALPPSNMVQAAAMPTNHLASLGPPTVSLGTYSGQHSLVAGFQNEHLNLGAGETPVAMVTGERRANSTTNERRTLSACEDSGSTCITSVSGKGSGAGGNNQPKKDSSGKFPCPHCHRTYLHLKHLKRHLLRHSGDRPYQCVLCKDTFSRSDILKRHFQKCSIRRGNPEGLSHLTHAHDHRKKKGKHVPTEVGLVTIKKADCSWSQTHTNLRTGAKRGAETSDLAQKPSKIPCSNCMRLKISCNLGYPCRECQASGTECVYATDRAYTQLSENDPLALPPSGFRQSTDSVLQQVDSKEKVDFPRNFHLQYGLQHNQYGDLCPDPVSPRGNGASKASGTIRTEPQMSNLSLPNFRSSIIPPAYYESFVFQPTQRQSQSRQTPHRGQELSADHDNFLQSIEGKPDLGGSRQETSLTYFQQTNTSSNPETTDLGWNYHIAEGFYHPLGDSEINYLFPFDATGSLTAPLIGEFTGAQWTLPQYLNPEDPIQAISDRLFRLLFPDCASPSPSSNSDATPSISSSHSLEQDDDEDLKPFITPNYIHHFVDCYKTNFQIHWPFLHLPTFDIETIHDSLLSTIVCVGAVYSDRGITVLQVRRLMDRTYSAMRFSPQDNEHNIASTDELQARLLFSTLETWHGNKKQRERNVLGFTTLVDMARRSNFFGPLTLHNCDNQMPSIFHQTEDDSDISKEFNWPSWIEQERRNRIMYGIYLLDTALVIYYNAAPRIGFWDLKLTLPSDDAAWEAPDEISCAESLGLKGSEARMRRNKWGTGMPKQAEISATLEDILTPGREFKPGMTNAYGKFIIIHAIHVYIWLKQKQFGTGHHGNPLYSPSILPGSQASHSNWSVTKSQAVRPSQIGGIPERQQKSAEVLRFNHQIAQALEKWKKCWDIDVRTQFSDNVPRDGFCRDGVAYYWLAVLFIRQKKRDLVLRSVGDTLVVSRVKGMLEAVIKRPQPAVPEKGGVNHIDDAYGVDELAFDMKLLFRPLKEAESDEVTR